MRVSMVQSVGSRKLLLDLLPALRRFARRLARSDDGGDDLLQEACERMLRHLDTRPEAGIGPAWCYAVVRNAWVDLIRRGRRVERNEQAAGTLFDRSDAAAAGMAEGPSAIDIWRAIDALPEHHREVILLCGIEGLDTEEVAQTLGVPAGTVRSRLARARLALAGAMEGREVNGHERADA